MLAVKSVRSVCGHTGNLEAACVGASRTPREAIDLGRQGATQVVAVIANGSSSAYREVSRSVGQLRRRLESKDGQRAMQCLCNCRFCLVDFGIRVCSRLWVFNAAHGNPNTRVAVSMLPAEVVKGILKQTGSANANKALGIAST